MAHSIKNILQSILKTDCSWKTDLLTKWPEIIGDLGSKVKLEKIQDSTLVLSVANACWMQELYLLSPLLIRTINEKLDQPRIKHLRFKQAELKKARPSLPVKKQACAPQEVTLSSQERAALDKISDPQLSSALKRFLNRCYLEKE
jgi:hypothetical protein